MVDNKFVFDPDIFIMSVRYAIGRTTYASISVIDNIKANIFFFPTNKLKIILRDVKEDLELYREHLWECDVNTWEGFIEWLEAVIEERTNDGK